MTLPPPEPGGPIGNELKAMLAPGAMSALTRLTSALRREGIWDDSSPNGRKLVLKSRQDADQEATSTAPTADGQHLETAKPAWRRNDPALTRAIAADRETGMTQTQIAAKQGVNVQTVRRHLAKTSTTKRAPLNQAQIQEAHRLRAAGWTLRDLAQRYSVAHTTLARALHRANDAPATLNDPSAGAQ